MFISIDTAQNNWSKDIIAYSRGQLYRFISHGLQLQEFMFVMTARQADSHRQSDRHTATNRIPTNIQTHTARKTDSL
jgi:hypothetical protein